MILSVEKRYFDLGIEPSPLCKKGRHDRCAAYDNMVIRCTCACHGKIPPTGQVRVAASELAEHFRNWNEPRLAEAVEGAVDGDDEHMARRVLALFTHGMGGLLDCPLYAKGVVNLEATSVRDELAERLHAAAKDGVR